MKQVVCLCQNGESGFIKQAEHPKALIPKSIVSPQSLAYIMNQKYTLAVPLYRQEREFKRLGFELSRQNLSNWILKGATLLKPLCGCLVHAKRKFHEALTVSPDNETAKTGEKYLCKLFALEHDADKRGMSLEERYALRQTKSKEIIDESIIG